MHRLINAVGFQIGWFICIASVRYGLDIPAICICGVLVGIHLFYADAPWNDVKLALLCLFFGIALDSGLQFFSVISFYGWALGPLSPFWLWMIWVMFALTLNSSLSFLQNYHLSLSALAGFLFGPLSYVAGAKLGAATLEQSLLPITTLAITWMITLPLLVFISSTALPHNEVTHDAT